LKFRDGFSQDTQISDFVKIPWEPSYSLRTGRWKDTHEEANSPFSQFYERA